MKLTTIGLVATTVTAVDGRFHPALRQALPFGMTHYWPHRTFNNEDEACAAAQLALDGLLERANCRVSQWNVVPL